MKFRLLLLGLAVTIVVAVFITGLVVWASSKAQLPLLPDQLLPKNVANRYSELGAAMAGGAIIAGTVLVAERLFAFEAEDRAANFQEKLQVESSGFQAGLQKDALRFQVSLVKDVSGIDLRDQDLSKSYWHGKIVKNAYLTRVRLNDSLLSGCNFESAFLFGANFANSQLDGAIFNAAKLWGADFERADLSGAHLYGAFFNEQEDFFTGNDDLGAANLTGAILTGADIRGANLKNARLAEADLEHTDLRGADLTGVVGMLETKNRDKAIHNDRTIWPDGQIGSPPPGFGS